MDSELEDLRAELATMKAENEELRTAVDPLRDPASAPRRRGWWRSVLSAVCIVLAGILVPVSVVATWTRARTRR